MTTCLCRVALNSLSRSESSVNLCYNRVIDELIGQENVKEVSLKVLIIQFYRISRRRKRGGEGLVSVPVIIWFERPSLAQAHVLGLLVA